ncbi:MAG TPA: hypothetical protein VHR66_30225 [Gemmataceae bacterium]|nr:hypothetical protein [Gemmataceae bacterium]
MKKSKDRVEKRGIIFLDCADNFKDPKNLGIAISAEAAAKFKAKGIADPAAHFLGKTIRVRGCVMRFEERPYLPVHDPDQIEIVGKKIATSVESDVANDISSKKAAPGERRGVSPTCQRLHVGLTPRRSP